MCTVAKRAARRPCIWGGIHCFLSGSRPYRQRCEAPFRAVARIVQEPSAS